MKVLDFIALAFLFPGDVVRKYAGISIEEDGGILRSFVNMVFWGVIFSVVAFQFV